jgi:EmrB/QacA subfamily drug resistance transporter
VKRRPVGPRLAVALTGSAVFLAYLDVAVVNVALPTIAHDFGATLTATSWTITAYTVTFTALLVTAGRIADARGRRRVFVAGVLAFGVGSALCATAPGLPWLVAFRVVQGVGAAVLLPVSLALLLPMWPEGRRGEAIGLWGMCGAVGGSLGPTVGGVLTAIDWRLIFLVNVPVTAAVAIAAWRLLDETPGSGDVHIDAAGIAVFAAGVAALVLSVIQAPEWGVLSWETVALLAVVAVAAIWLVRLERRAAEPVLDLALFRIRRFAIGTASSTLFFLAFLGHGLASVLFLQYAWGYGPAKAGVAYAVGPAVGILANLVGGRFVDRHGYRRVGIAGLLVYAGALALFGLWVAPGPESYLTRYLPVVCVSSICLGFVFPAMTGAGTADVPPQLLATSTGVLNTVRQVGGVVGIALVVAVIGSGSGGTDAFRRLYLGLCAAVLLAALSMAALRRVPRAAPR